MSLFLLWNAPLNVAIAVARIGRRRWDQRLVQVSGIAIETVREMGKSVCYDLFTRWIRTGGDVGIVWDVNPACRVNRLLG